MGTEVEPSTARLRLALPSRFDFHHTVFGHGWVSLSPFEWRAQRESLSLAVEILGGIVDVELRASRGKLEVRVQADEALSPSQRRELRLKTRRMMGLDDDLAAFWALCAAHPHLRWISRRGAGRLLRAPSLFEDLLKLLFTTNCSWAATKRMSARLVEALGKKSPLGQRAFPSARACAEAGAGFFREVVRAGYRSGSAERLSELFARGPSFEERLSDPQISTEELRRILLSLPGFGPYAAGQALRLLGRYEDLALDSWCRNKLARLLELQKPPSDRRIARRYASFGRYKGLVLWMELTADWHRGSEGVDEFREIFLSRGSRTDTEPESL